MAKYTIFKAQESSLEKELEETVEFFRTKNVSINFRDERELNAMRIAEKNSKKDDTEKGSTSSSVKGKGKENKVWDRLCRESAWIDKPRLFRWQGNSELAMHVPQMGRCLHLDTKQFCYMMKKMHGWTPKERKGSFKK